MKGLLFSPVILAAAFASLAVSILTGCGQSDKAAIRTCFADYQSALERKDGQAAAALVSKQTMSFYGSILKLVLNGDETTVRNLKFYRKMMVLQIRHEAPQIQNMAGSNFVAFLVSKGWVGTEAAPNVKLGGISFEGKAAKAAVQVNGEETPATFLFFREGNSWKFDLTWPALRLEHLMEEKQKQSPISEDDAIIQVLEMRSGRTVSKNVWQPLKPK